MEIRFQITRDELSAGINRALAASEDFTPAMREIAGMMEFAVRERFERGEDPSGKPWQPSQRALEQGGKTLSDTAALLSSVASDSDRFSAVVGTNLIYAAIHQFGGEQQVPAHQRTVTSVFGRKLPAPATQSVRAHSRTMPARPFLGFGPYETEEIETILGDHLRRAFEGRA